MKIVSASFCVNHFVAGAFTTKPDDVAAVQNDRLVNVWDGTSQNQWSNTPKPWASPFNTGICSGVNPVMICGVLLVGGLTALLRSERTDVVGDEAVHRRRLTRLGASSTAR